MLLEGGGGGGDNVDVDIDEILAGRLRKTFCMHESKVECKVGT